MRSSGSPTSERGGRFVSSSTSCAPVRMQVFKALLHTQLGAAAPLAQAEHTLGGGPPHPAHVEQPSVRGIGC